MCEVNVTKGILEHVSEFEHFGFLLDKSVRWSRVLQITGEWKESCRCNGATCFISWGSMILEKETSRIRDVLGNRKTDKIPKT